MARSGPSVLKPHPGRPILPRALMARGDARTFAVPEVPGYLAAKIGDGTRQLTFYVHENRVVRLTRRARPGRKTWVFR